MELQNTQHLAPSTQYPVTVTLWGTGQPRREFLHVDEMADARVFVMNKVDFSNITIGMKDVKNTHINIGCGEDLTIRGLSYLIKEVIGFKGTIEWDITKPDGTYQKLLDVSKLTKLGWRKRIELKHGISLTYSKYHLD